MYHKERNTEERYGIKEGVSRQGKEWRDKENKRVTKL